jgi:hypothetical protein
MSPQRDRAVFLGAGTAACAACCAGPILGVLAAIGLTTAAATFLFGAVALVIAGAAVLVVLRERRNRSRTRAIDPGAVEVRLTSPAPGTKLVSSTERQVSSASVRKTTSSSLASRRASAS